MRGIFKDSNIFGKILQLLVVSLFCFFFGIIIGQQAGLAIDSELSSLRVLQTIYTVFSYLIPPFILAYFWTEEPPARYLHLDAKMTTKQILCIILLMVVAIPFINLLADLNNRIPLPDSLSDLETKMRLMEERATMQTEKLLYTNNIGGLLVNILLIAIIPAVSEELFFRGLLQGELMKWRNNLIMIWVSAFIFSAVHFQFYGFIPRMLLGAFFGYLLLWSRSLWLPILAHFLNNCIVVVFNYLRHNGYIHAEIDSYGTGSSWWLGCICGLLFFAGVFYIRKMLLQKQSPAILPNKNEAGII